MCLFIFLDCPAHSPFTLHNVLTNPSRAVLEAGLIRCLWYEALTGTSGTKQDPSAKRPAQTSEFQDENHACPYVVIKHDVEMFGGEAEAVQRINEAVLVGGIAHNERGCSDCWDVLYRKGWVGIMPNEAEKMKVLYTTDTGCSAREGLRRTQVGPQVESERVMTWKSAAMKGMQKPKPKPTTISPSPKREWPRSLATEDASHYTCLHQRTQQLQPVW